MILPGEAEYFCIVRRAQKSEVIVRLLKEFSELVNKFDVAIVIDFLIWVLTELLVAFSFLDPLVLSELR